MKGNIYNLLKESLLIGKDNLMQRVLKLKSKKRVCIRHIVINIWKGIIKATNLRETQVEKEILIWYAEDREGKAQYILVNATKMFHKKIVMKEESKKIKECSDPLKSVN